MRWATLFVVSVIISVLLLSIAGCVPPQSQEAAAEEATLEDDALPSDQTPVESPQQPAAEESQDIPEQEESSIQISGSLNLQDDLSKCPHLAESFECDRYDISRCKFKTLVGKDDFYPDYIYCRDGRLEDGEKAGRKYCFIQECRPLEKESIVYAYGGPVTWGEYIYTVDKVDGGIMTHYQLVSCGEDRQEFEDSFDCTTYRSTLGNI